MHGLRQWVDAGDGAPWRAERAFALGAGLGLGIGFGIGFGVGWGLLFGM